jgi:hypothetical protein
VGSWDLGGVKRSWRIPARECGGGLSVARRKKREAGGEGVQVGFYRRARPCRREGEREGQSRAGFKTASGAGVPSGAWQPFGTGGPTWLRGNGQQVQHGRWEEGSLQEILLSMTFSFVTM